MGCRDDNLFCFISISLKIVHQEIEIFIYQLFSVRSWESEIGQFPSSYIRRIKPRLNSVRHTVSQLAANGRCSSERLFSDNFLISCSKISICSFSGSGVAGRSSNNCFSSSRLFTSFIISSFFLYPFTCPTSHHWSSHLTTLIWVIAVSVFNSLGNPFIDCAVIRMRVPLTMCRKLLPVSASPSYRKYPEYLCVKFHKRWYKRMRFTQHRRQPLSRAQPQKFGNIIIGKIVAHDINKGRNVHPSVFGLYLL